MKKNKEELYLRIIDQMPNPIWRAGLDAKCDFFNKSWLNFTGRTMEQEMGNGWTEGVFEEDFDNCLKTYLDAFKKEQAFEMEYRLKHKDGTYHWILDSGSPFYDDKGVFAGYIGSCYDINESKEYELLFSNMAGGFAYHKIITNELNEPIDYQFIDVNPFFEKIINKKRKDIIGKKVTEVLPGIKKDPANWIKKYGQIAQNGKSMMFENYSEILQKWFSVSAYSPKKNYFITIFEDITEIKNKLVEIEKMNKLMINRELKMIKLKKELKDAKMKSK
ncbi:MAG: PAS domain S-box protein [Patescibacteria group bacterium]|jgi:PAS domain S-box-containing protein|nr:PAS domain S-box protein [Patescibacteria group bacterium]